MKFYLVTQSLLRDPHVWLKIEEQLAKAIAYHPFMTSQLVYANALSGHTGIMIGTDGSRIVAACALEILAFSDQRVANIYLLGADIGFLDNVDAFIDFVKQWAKARGCAKLMIMGRKGWLRTLKRIGARHQESITGWMDI